MASKKGTTKKRGGRGGQAQIPGTERQIDPEVSKAADDLYAVQTKRLENQREEKRLRDRLIEICAEKGVGKYIDDELELNVEFKQGAPTVSVKRYRPEQADATE